LITPSDDVLIRHNGNRKTIVACCRGGLGSFLELSEIPIPVLNLLYEQMVEVEILFNPHLKKD
jgi:hypothetical protein